MRLTAVATALLLAPAGLGYAEISPIELQWRAFEKLCSATFAIAKFPQVVAGGISFQTAARATKKDLRTFTTKTCPQNWHALNGERTLKEIIPEFERLSRVSVKLTEEAGSQSEYVAKVYASIARGLRVADVDFGTLNCGKALQSMVRIFRSESDALHKRYVEIRACPALAKLEKEQKATAGASHTYGTSGPSSRVPSGSQGRSGADITGTEKAIRDEGNAKRILEK